MVPVRRGGWIVRLLLIGLILSIVWNFVLYSSYEQYFAASAGPRETYHSGDRLSTNKIALLEMRGTIMPPFTERLRKAIKEAREDDGVKGVVLVIDSPGGLVADSHQIYHDLKQLREQKPVYVAMQRLAASGGYYIGMGAGPEGRIFAEPTTWTGSIGVIIPRFDLTELAQQAGVESDPLKTGELKDALNPFREMTPREREVWTAIMNDSFERFLQVIDENRMALDAEETRALATGQIYTAEQALKNGLVDEIGFQEEAVEALKKKLELSDARIVR
jgi:protease-4